jgi:hypothetical protein
MPTLSEWAGEYMTRVVYSGSYSKGTAIRGLTDVDLFVSLKATTPHTLADIYSNLYRFLKDRRFHVQKRDVAVKIRIADLDVDVVPGRRQQSTGQDHSLYSNRLQTWRQTNIDKHAAIVRASGRIQEICALKVWAVQHGVDIPSFLLELAVIRGLRGRLLGRTAMNVARALEFLSSDFLDARLVDPANTGNVVSDSLTTTEKRLIARAADESLRSANWEGIIW